MLYDQLAEFCDCAGEFTDKDVYDLISVVSLATGWMQEPCETFEVSERREVIDLPSCMDCPYIFEPYYYPYDPESFSFSLLKIKGLEEETTPLEYMYSPYLEKFRVDLGLSPCDCIKNDCGCPTEYKLVVTYKAGYDEIPSCLLPVFCNLIEVIHAKNDCDCAPGCGCDNPQATYDANGNLVTNPVKYKTGDPVSVFLETDLAKMLVEQYKNQLGLISLVRWDPDVWGCVV